MLASGSLAPQFPWVPLDGVHYWDGGLVDNAPLADAIDSFSADPQVSGCWWCSTSTRCAPGSRPTFPRCRIGCTSSATATGCARTPAPRERVNQLVSTIDELAALVPPEAMPDALRARGRPGPPVQDRDRGGRGHAEPGRRHGLGTEQSPVDDAEGLRDFSARTVELRRSAGYRITTEKLAPHL